MKETHQLKTNCITIVEHAFLYIGVI